MSDDQHQNVSSNTTEVTNDTSNAAGSLGKRVAFNPSPRLTDPEPAGPPVITVLEGGEGGPPSQPKVTNAEFIGAIFPSVGEGEFALALAKHGDPKDGGWLGFDAKLTDGRCLDDTNNYVNCATFRRTDDGELRALETQAVAYHCLVLDDIGTKTPLSALPSVEPTWMLETSPGNYQVGYRLATPIADPAVVKAAQQRISRTGIGDRGAGGMGRWVRLPNGINGKAKYRDEDGKPFRCRLTEWSPEISYELKDLVELLAPGASNLGAMASPALTPAAESAPFHPGINSDVFIQPFPENPVVTALKNLGLYKAETSPGRHEISCPWRGEHTDPEADRAYLFEPSAEFPMGGFKCHHSHGDRHRLGALLKHLELDRTDFHNKPRIRVVEGELQAMVDAAQAVLAGTGEYFQAGGLIVKIAIDHSSGAASLQAQSDADLTLALSSAATWERPEVKGDAIRWRRCNPLPNCIRLLLQAQNYAFLPHVVGIARQPMLLADGQVLSRAGYDQSSKFYCAFDATKFARPEATEANARAALARLNTLLREFHFATSRDRATTLAAIFTAVFRVSLGRAPGIHVTAPAPGSGKSLLCELLARFAGPGHPAKISFPRTEEEATKVILAALLSAPAVIDFDDMTQDWRAFGAINRLLTSATMTERILSMSKMATVSTDTLVLGSGNNTGPTGDLTRRVIVINLDTREESPATIRYEGDPLGEMDAKRAAFVSDVLLIVEAWIVAGRPRADLSPIASYGGLWTDYCRQPLVWLGLEDPAAGLIEQVTHNPEMADLGRFLTAWHAQLRDTAVTLRGLMEAAEGDLAEVIEDLPFNEGTLQSRTSRFGHYLKRNAGRPINGLKIEKAVSRERNAWRVVTVDPVAATESRGHLATPLPPPPPPTGPDRATRDTFD